MRLQSHLDKLNRPCDGRPPSSARGHKSILAEVYWMLSDDALSRFATEVRTNQGVPQSGSVYLRLCYNQVCAGRVKVSISL